MHINSLFQWCNVIMNGMMILGLLWGAPSIKINTIHCFTPLIRLKIWNFRLLNKLVLFCWLMLKKLDTVNGSYSKKLSLIRAILLKLFILAGSSIVMLLWSIIKKSLILLNKKPKMESFLIKNFILPSLKL